MAGTITKTVKCVAQLLASVTMLLMTMGVPPAAAMTMEEVTAAYERGNYTIARFYVTTYAVMGGADAQFMLGNMYALGQGGAKDNEAAERWYRKAAEQGEPRAQFGLGIMYATRGTGVAEDATEAMRWFRLAAEQGDVNAQAYLGAMYDTGEGVPEDAVDAYAWLNIAAAQGNTSAKELKEIVAKHMSRAQIAEVQKRSPEYWTRYVVPFQ